MGGEEGLYYVWGGPPGPDDLGQAWDAAERYAVTLLWEALPEAQAVPVPVEELTAEVARFRSAARKRPYKQLARVAWGQRPGRRSPADDTDFWLDAAGAMATMRRHVGVDSPSLEPVTLLRPADWAGAVIGMVRSGVNTIVMAEDLVRYARQCPEITSTTESGDEAAAYDPFTGGVVDDESLRRGFEAALLSWEAIGAVSEQRWLTSLGVWGLPRALARAWNGEFDRAGWVNSTELDGTEGSWPGRAPTPAELGIVDPPYAT
ncbi:MAG TPA: hypothetical protein VF070_29445 [Streptosporangiaceae bacterium]